MRGDLFSRKARVEVRDPGPGYRLPPYHNQRQHVTCRPLANLFKRESNADYFNLRFINTNLFFSEATDCAFAFFEDTLRSVLVWGGLCLWFSAPACRMFFFFLVYKPPLLNLGMGGLKES